MGFVLGVRCMQSLLTINRERRVTYLEGHGPQRHIASIRQSKSKEQLLLQFSRGADRLLGEGRSTGSQERAIQRYSKENTHCKMPLSSLSNMQSGFLLQARPVPTSVGKEEVS